jgi:hypothetical protein
MTIEEKRKLRYLKLHFLEFEASTYSTIPFNIPYAKLMRKDREREYKQAVTDGWTTAQFNASILQRYEAQGWSRPNEPLNDASAFRALRWWESEWRNTAPNDVVSKYVSPSARVSHHKDSINLDLVRKQRKQYRELNKDKIAQYRRTHRQQTNEARKKLKEFKRGV